MGDEEDEEESDAVVTQVLDELGLQLGDQLTDVPATGGTLAAPAGKGKTPVAAGADVSAFCHNSNYFGKLPLKYSHKRLYHS